jgi:hypothetical protein
MFITQVENEDSFSDPSHPETRRPGFSLHRLWDEIQGENEGRMTIMESKQEYVFYSYSNTILVWKILPVE